jgi:hypothetical protein
MSMIRALVKGLFAAVLVVVLVALLVGAWQEHRYRAAMPLGEVVGPAEDAAMANAVGMALRMINRTRDGLIDEGLSGAATPADLPQADAGGPRQGTGEPVIFRRDVHIKSHGCVKATFTVPELESRFRWGVFSQPGQFPAWIRYSNGDYVLHPDKARDARGMAIKLMGVPGRKLLEWKPDAPTQDFVMMNSTNYFIRELDDYVELTKYLAVGDNFGYFTNNNSPNLLSWRWRELRLVIGTKKPPPETPLMTQYFSASAYKLGPDQNIKFSARPVQCAGAEPAPRSRRWQAGKDKYNFLRLRMAEQLENAPACFDFLVQPQVPGKAMPVEDATIAWSEKDSAFVKVAHIEIPAQSFNTAQQDAFCESLSFNPWHSLADHRPIGVFNRVRKALYEEVAKYRWASNEALASGEAVTLQPGQPPEPEGWCLDGTRGCAP